MATRRVEFIQRIFIAQSKKWLAAAAPAHQCANATTILHGFCSENDFERRLREPKRERLRLRV
jgi:hypothetical protein